MLPIATATGNTNIVHRTSCLKMAICSLNEMALFSVIAIDQVESYGKGC
jgi:hypothetical protein